METLFYEPKNVFIVNILTLEQENIISSSREMFYNITNANEIRMKLYPRPRESIFYELYISCGDEDRKMPPFNKLLFFEDSLSTLFPKFKINMELPRVETCVNLEDENSNGSFINLGKFKNLIEDTFTNSCEVRVTLLKLEYLA